VKIGSACVLVCAVLCFWVRWMPHWRRGLFFSSFGVEIHTKQNKRAEIYFFMNVIALLIRFQNCTFCVYILCT
jgi:hypothetical protein